MPPAAWGWAGQSRVPEHPGQISSQPQHRHKNHIFPVFQLARFAPRFHHLPYNNRVQPSLPHRRTSPRTGSISLQGLQMSISSPAQTHTQVTEARRATHRMHRKGAVPVEKGVRDWHSEALSGTGVLGGEGHFSLLDTVGDRRERRGSIGGLLNRGGESKRQEKQRKKAQKRLWIKGKKR